ncbi:MAG: hypothetical protein CBC55_07615 [Gammaproteobacteria bacterium TMED95]|nr:molecular chaperone DnaJ [Gammaproteobacteria bacterium]OUV20840.1 MAG: hypothetical protein CBC55_07615 [Gammaproteobacteria bacterium TMED95]
MMARIFLGVVIAAGIYLLLRAVLAKKPLSLKQFFSIYVAILLIIGLIGLGLTGRLHPITASLGVGLTVLTRALPMLMRMFQAVNLWRTLKAALGMASAQRGPKSGNHSEVDSHYLRMRLDHDSGELDGTILAGRFTGETLSSLTLDALLAFREEIEEDEASCQLLDTFLDRYHDWQEQAPSSNAGNLTTQEAEAILGLTPPYDRAAVIAAHRKLMQRHHPDRGGNHEFAARLNAAKDQILNEC